MVPISYTVTVTAEKMPADPIPATALEKMSISILYVHEKGARNENAFKIFNALFVTVATPLRRDPTRKIHVATISVFLRPKMSLSFENISSKTIGEMI